MDAPKRILFVCTGNICRSAMADHLLRHISEQKGLGLEVRSAGTAAEGWYKMPEHAKALLAEAGVPVWEHKAQLLTREHLRWAELVLVMAGHHLDHIVELYPEFTRKTKLLREAAGLDEADVDDPMNRPREDFEKALASIRQSLDALLSRGFKTP